MNRSAPHPSKHEPFQSIYKTQIEVVEERHDAVRLYPHTEQLPVLLRALNLEFLGGLPGHIARVDKRADGYHKILRRMAALMFCSSMNGARQDRLRLFELTDMDLVARVSIVQQITVESKQGPLHWFRFYAGADFVPEILLSGKRLLFTEHVLERFSTRVPLPVGADLSNFLLLFYGSPHIQMQVGPGPAFVMDYLGSILAFTFKETENEFIITTCLTIDEMNSLQPELPPRAFNLHYGTEFKVPRVRHWIPSKWMLDRYQCWERKVPLPPLAGPRAKWTWSETGHWVKDHVDKTGHGPGSGLVFADHIPGPCVLEIKPNQIETEYNELDAYKKTDSKFDWDAIFAEQESQLNKSKPA